MATVTSTVPALVAEVVAVIEVSELTVKLDAALTPNLTPVALVNPLPVIATDVPPAVGPSVGLIDVTTGVP